ncbi:MAG: hypothetical protein WAW46_06395 [Polaromonas sp.]
MPSNKSVYGRTDNSKRSYIEAASPITAANVPPIKPLPAAADQISFANNVVTIAD